MRNAQGKSATHACLECPLALVCTSRGTKTIVVEVFHCNRCRCDEVRITMDTGKFVSSEPDVRVPKDCPRLEEFIEHHTQSDSGYGYVCTKCQNRPLTDAERALIEAVVNRSIPGGDEWPKP